MDLISLERELVGLRSLPTRPRPEVEELTERGRRRRRRRRSFVAVAVAMLAVGVIGVGAAALDREDGTRVASEGTPTSSGADGGEVAVPDVIGWTIGRARPALAAVGLELSVDPANDAAVDGALIVATEPGGGSLVPLGAIVGARTALPDPPVEVECPNARHPRGAADPDALPQSNSLTRLAAESARSALHIQLEQEALDRGGPDPGTTVFLGLWNRWAYSNDGASVSVARTVGYQVVVVLSDPNACPPAPEFREVPITYVAVPAERWAIGSDDQGTSFNGVDDGVTASGDSTLRAAQLADLVGCGDRRARVPDPGEPIDPVDALDCFLGETAVGIQVYRSAENRDEVVAYLHQFAGYRVLGDAWLVAVDTPEGAEEVARLTGGQVVELAGGSSS